METRFRQIHTLSDTYDERWSPSELRSYTRASIRKALETHPVILFVDALDECGQKSEEQLAEEFNSLLHWPSSKCLKHFRICLTCRHYPVVNIDAGFEICVDRENAGDISLFVESKLRPFQEQTGSRISEFISQHAEGVFLWASLVVGKVLSLDRDRLETAMIESEIPLVELHWAIVLAQSKGLDSLQEFGGPDCLQFNGGAMEWKAEMLGHDLIELPSLHKSTDSEETPHYWLAKICLLYLEMVEDPLVADAKAKSKFPFLSYATSCWGFHISHLPDNLQESFPWPWDASVTRHYLRGGFICRVLFNGWTGALRGILSKSSGICVDVDKEVYVGRTPLHPAATFVHISIVKLLLENGAQPNKRGVLYWTPLHYAARYGRTAVMESLLASGAKVNSKDPHGQTPLVFAIDHGDTAATELFFERGAQIDYNYKVIFKLAFEDDLFHKVTRVALLGLHYLDEEFGGPFSQLTKFFEAAFSGEYDMPNRILIPASWRTPLSRAAELGDQKAVRLLLRYDARPEDKDEDGETTLSRAEKNDKKEVIQILHESMG
ncbi:hypothetical protein FVEG_15238 [Fusarium verticillioides 7600]|uniref:Uncharacterized protein n=1 Tax=Gibberella moniliformis (strain M3125 / FGSC 7600) TaxID=334819 RepID=W7LP28_GIBM7|nr:hypothetical protein FVEG_15238 [Fusarium verticillioides 7600]EWG41148.1 hypothetical protein FVEG_15238 [Fusarium verticillioides 7600]